MNIIILGQQGCGKGTQAELLASKYKLFHIDMGKFLGEVAKIDSDLGRKVWEIQNVSKTLVPSHILREVFTVKLNSISREQGIVFDGFPRNLDQAVYFEEILERFGRHIDKVIFINIPKEESVKRISKRFFCESCRSNFIMGKDLNSEKELCPKCKGVVSKREDDTIEGIEKRLKVFNEETMPVIKKFKEEGVLVEIDGVNSKKNVFLEIEKEIFQLSN